MKAAIKILLLTTMTALILSGCAKKTQTSEEKQVSALKTLNIGYQKAALKLIVAKQNQLFEKEFPELKIQWKEFPAGPQTLEALTVNSIDFGYTGDAPVVFALSAGKELKYLGFEQSSQQAHAILLPVGSQLQSLADLKSKRIAVTRGSSAHNFLAETLKKANLTWQEIEPLWLTPSDARAALDKKAVDAWAVWDPYISAAEIDGNARVLFDSTELPKTYAFYLGQPNFVNHYPDVAKRVIKVLNETDGWISEHLAETAQILAKSTGLDVTIAEKVIAKKHTPNLVNPLNAHVIESQRAIAQVFYEQNLIPQTITPEKFVWNHDL